jgi:hypothetical protein
MTYQPDRVANYVLVLEDTTLRLPCCEQVGHGKVQDLSAI